MIDFIVRETPKSQGADNKSKRRWQERIRNAVPPESELLTGPLRLRIDYFFDGSENPPDTDNIIKPIQDALKETLYDDDNTVVDVCARSIDLHNLPTLEAVPPTLLRALDEPPEDFVFIQVTAVNRRLTFT